MSVTYFVNGTSPVGPFTQDFEDLLIAFLYSKWSISAPAKDGTNLVDEDTPLAFRTGLPDDRHPFQVLALTDETVLIDKPGFRTSRYETSVIVSVIAERIAKDNIDANPDTVGNIGNMEREVLRILAQYTTFQIFGIENIYFTNAKRIYEPDDDFAKSRWRTDIRVVMNYTITGDALP